MLLKLRDTAPQLGLCCERQAFDALGALVDGLCVRVCESSQSVKYLQVLYAVLFFDYCNTFVRASMASVSARIWLVISSE